MIRTFALNPTPIQTTTIGIQAIGGIGRIISKMGVNVLSSILYHPIRSPRGTPMITAEKKPKRETCRLARIFAERRLPSGAFFVSLARKVSYILAGEACGNPQYLGLRQTARGQKIL